MTQSRAIQISLVELRLTIIVFPVVYVVLFYAVRISSAGKALSIAGNGWSNASNFCPPFLLSIPAIMSNHYHLVLHVNELENSELTDEEVCLR
jgi:hypothetical protein